jgi:hypothetical protein
MLITCPECAKELSDTATTCPHCGYAMTDADRESARTRIQQQNLEAQEIARRKAETATLAARNNRRWSIAMWIGASLFVIWVWRSCSTADSTTPQGENCSDSISAKIMAENFMEKRLKSPSTADFCNSASDFAAERDGSNWVVTGCVDSENSFGATIRTNFKVTMTCATDGWTLVNLTTD